MKIVQRSRFPWEPEGVLVELETPEQIQVEYRVAPFGVRMMGAGIDALAVGTVVAVVFITGLAVAADMGDLETVNYVLGLGTVAAFILMMFYHVVTEVWLKGLTLGKYAVKCRVIMTSGQALTVGAALLRNLSRVVEILPPLWLVPALNPARRRIGDYLAGTLVVMADRQPVAGVEPLAGQNYSELRDRQFVFTAEHASNLVADDLNLLEYFFRNQYRLAGRRGGNAIAAGIATKYVERLALDDQAEAIDADPGRFLQELYLFLKERLEAEVF